MAKGFKSGGRAAKTPNKRTVQKMLEASGQIADIKKLGQKKATEVLNEMMQMSLEMVHDYRERLAKSKRPSDNQIATFKWAVECTGTFARALAPFQDPTFKAITVTPAALPPPMVLGDNAKVIKGKVVKIDDPNELVRTYQQMVKRVA